MIFRELNRERILLHERLRSLLSKRKAASVNINDVYDNLQRYVESQSCKVDSPFTLADQQGPVLQVIRSLFEDEDKAYAVLLNKPQKPKKGKKS